MTTTHLTKDQVPEFLREGYSGNKFTAVVTTTVTIPRTAGLWDGGSRDTYRVANLSTGGHLEFREYHQVKLGEGLVVIKHSIFAGRDTGLTIYVHPDNAAKLLPAPADELTTLERVILKATKSFKSSYAGKDRYDMALEDYELSRLLGAPPSRDEWNKAKGDLVARGLLNKAGAITVKGKNAIG